METSAIRVAASPVRCPFCHDGLALAEPWVACGVCLARHHAECWQERSACASCKAPVSLAPSPPRVVTITLSNNPPLERRAQRRRKARIRRLVLGTAVVVLAAASIFLIITRESPVSSGFGYSFF